MTKPNPDMESTYSYTSAGNTGRPVHPMCSAMASASRVGLFVGRTSQDTEPQWREFTCPKCGSHEWGSSRCLGHFSQWIGHCHGHKDGRSCNFTWHRQSQDHAVMKASPASLESAPISPEPAQAHRRALPNAVMQTTPTNCFSACVATVLGIPITEVPIACDGAWWDWDAFQDWLAGRGLQAIEMTFENGGTLYPVRRAVRCILTGPSPRECTTGRHAIVGDYIGLDGFELLHDPHESQMWLDGEPTHAVFFVPLTTPATPSAAAEEWRHLEAGELIEAGDETDRSVDHWLDPVKWEPVHPADVGQPAPDPAYPAHRIFRRRVTPSAAVGASEPVAGEQLRAEVGKRYVRRDGKVSGVLGVTPATNPHHKEFPLFDFENAVSYDIAGGCDPFAQRLQDLIAEYHEQHPAESSDDWVMITDPKHVIRRVDSCRKINDGVWTPCCASVGATIDEWKNLEFRCRRKNLPVVPADKPVLPSPWRPMKEVPTCDWFWLAWNDGQVILSRDRSHWNLRSATAWMPAVPPLHPNDTPADKPRMRQVTLRECKMGNSFYWITADRVDVAPFATGRTCVTEVPE